MKLFKKYIAFLDAWASLVVFVVVRERSQRLENPFELAEILLSETPEFDKDTIQAILDTRVTTNYSLEEPIPIFILYFTYFIDSEGNSYTLQDVYGRDEMLLSEL